MSNVDYSGIERGAWQRPLGDREVQNEELHSQGGGGDNGGMDSRLAHLEKRVDSIDGRLGRIEGDVAALKGDVSDVKIAIASLDAKLDIGSIRASVERSHTDIYKWAVSIIAVIGAIYFGLQRVGPAGTAGQPAQPTVIYVQPAPVSSEATPTPAPRSDQ